jgi:hypothetical protein
MTTNRSVLRRLTSQGMLDMFEGVDPRFDWTLGYQKGGELFHEEDFLEGDALHLGSGGAILWVRVPSPASTLALGAYNINLTVLSTPYLNNASVCQRVCGCVVLQTFGLIRQWVCGKRPVILSKHGLG